MPERTNYAPGTPSWIDLATPDVPDPQGAMFSVLTWTEPTD